MKFSQIADGQQFEYKGVIYHRNGPVMAIDAAGNSKMIPRSAEVKAVPVSTPQPKPDLLKQISVEQAINAFELFYGQIIHCLQNEAKGEDLVKVSDLQQCMESARKSCLQALSS